MHRPPARLHNLHAVGEREYTGHLPHLLGVGSVVYTLLGYGPPCPTQSGLLLVRHICFLSEMLHDTSNGFVCSADQLNMIDNNHVSTPSVRRHVEQQAGSLTGPLWKGVLPNGRDASRSSSSDGLRTSPRKTHDRGRCRQH